MMTETQKLLADDHEVGEAFGSSVAIEGTAIAVGVPLDNGCYGSAYVFDSSPVPLDSVSVTEPVLCGVKVVRRLELNRERLPERRIRKRRPASQRAQPQPRHHPQSLHVNYSSQPANTMARG